MSWTSMRFGLPNTAAIIALMLVPIAAVMFEPTMIAGSAPEPAALHEPARLGSVASGLEVAGADNNISR